MYTVFVRYCHSVQNNKQKNPNAKYAEKAEISDNNIVIWLRQTFGFFRRLAFNDAVKSKLFMTS